MRTRGQRLIRHLDKRLVLSRLFRFITLTAGVLIRGHVKVLIYRVHSRKFKSVWTHTRSYLIVAQFRTKISSMIYFTFTYLHYIF